VVPPGSRQALSNASDVPSAGYGEGTLGDVAESEALRLPDLTTVFARRAERLKALADGHELADFLRMIGTLTAAQHTALDGLPAGALPGSREVIEAVSEARAPIDPSGWKRDASWRAALARILDAVDESLLPEPARLARARLAAADAETLEALAERYLGGEVSEIEAAQGVFVAAALQVAWTRMAALLDKADLKSEAPETGLCPVCRSPSVAGVVSPGGTRFGHRHLHCSLCATAWRYVRVRCVHCGSTEKVSFRQFAGTSYLRAECCESCRGYSKVFYLEKAKVIEPLADDLASLGLDLKVGEEGFSRVPNPFVLGG
jgi:FdhE protein